MVQLIDNLNEYTRNELLVKSKSLLPNRADKKSESVSRWRLEKVDLAKLSSSDDLVLNFKVKDYKVAVKVLKFKPLLHRYLSRRTKANRITKWTRDEVQTIVNQAINTCDLLVRCDCADWIYRFSYLATKENYGYDTNENRPAQITNPDNLGALCKHLVVILNNPSAWIPKLSMAVKLFIESEIK